MAFNGRHLHRDQRIMKSYDAVFAAAPKYANRVSYVIAPDGRIVHEYTSLHHDKHVANTPHALPNRSARTPADG